MDLVEKLQKLAVDVPRRQEAAIDEANTGSYLVDPFLLALGYNPTEPDDVQKELTADVGRRRNKADYVLKQAGVEIILLEIKPVGTNLSEWVSQLDGYFRNKEDIKFAMLADGIIYWFFSDFDSPNVMDKEPFLILDLRKIHKSIVDIVDVVSLFTKSRFHRESAIEAARLAKDRFRVRRVLNAEINPLSSALVSYFIERISPGRLPKTRREELNKLVKRAWQEFLTSTAKQKAEVPATHEGTETQEKFQHVTLQSKSNYMGDSVAIPVHIDYRPRGSKQKYVLNGTLILKDDIGRNQKIVEYDEDLHRPSEAAGRALRSVNPGVSNPNGWVYWTFVNPNTGEDQVIDVLTKDTELRRQLLRGD